MRDIDSDVLSDKITLAVKLGKGNAKKYHLILIGTAMFLSVVFTVLYFRDFYNLLFLITFIPLGLHIKAIKNAKQPQDFDSQLKVLALTTFLFSVLLGVGYII
jgi:1,4-dihydroxy-2-naphthoate octaprenyltransferase